MTFTGNWKQEHGYGIPAVINDNMKMNMLVRHLRRN